MIPSLREELIVAYLEGDSPDVEEVQAIATMSDAKIAELYAVWDGVKPHDGCISYEDSVRLALYVYEGGLRAVRTTNKAHQCIVCQEGFDTNGLAFEIGSHVADYCADCAQMVADVMKHHFPDDEEEGQYGPGLRGSQPGDEEFEELWEQRLHQSQDEEEDDDYTITCTGCGGERIIEDEVILSATPENGLCAEELDECPSTTDLLQEALEESLQPDAIVATGDRRQFNGRPKGIKEEQPREVCVSSCCGTEGARTRDGSCKGCR